MTAAPATVRAEAWGDDPPPLALGGNSCIKIACWFAGNCGPTPGAAPTPEPLAAGDSTAAVDGTAADDNASVEATAVTTATGVGGVGNVDR